MTSLSNIPSLDLQILQQWQEKPAPFEPGEAQFWTDPHIAKQMLAVHLDPNIDAASRRPETIESTVDWIIQTLGLQTGDHVLDLGCGPGLYTARLAQRGLHVSGVDFSQNSIDYAREYAHQNGLAIEYRCLDYLLLQDQAQYDAVMLIYGDFCPLSSGQRARLLENVHRALKAGGRFVLDVTTPYLRQREGSKNGWYVSPGGFWKPGLHLVLEQGFAYDDDIFLDQYIVIEENGKMSVYRNWFQDYGAERIRAELEDHGFSVESLWGDLTGAPLEPEGNWIGVIARRA